jgi:glycosyltransferase involved in cell wall biosynthesis
MRIHLVTDQFSLGGGIEHIYQVTKGMQEHRFAVFAQAGPAVEKFAALKNVEICNKGYSPSYILAQSPDLVHFHHLKPLAAFYKIPFKTYKVPLIFTAHGLHIHKYEFYDSFSARLKYFFRFHLEKRILPRVDRIIAVSREDKQFMEDKYKLDQVVYLSNGIDDSAVRDHSGESKAALRKRLKLPQDAFLFITVARFNFQKGYDILIRAISTLKRFLENEAPSCRFIFVGDGPDMEAMKGLCRELSVTRYIRFLGASNQVYSILRAGDACLLPSRWEGLPIVLLETGLLKVPVVASDTYGNREIIGKGNGILFKNRDILQLAAVIAEVLRDQHDLAGYAQNMYREVRTNYSLEKMLSGLKDIYTASNLTKASKMGGI